MVFRRAALASVYLMFTSGCNRNKATADEPKRLVASVLLFATAFLFSGLVNAFEIHRTVHQEIIGSINTFTVTGGSSPTSNIPLLSDAGTFINVHANYSGSNIGKGESARVHFVQYNHQLLDLTMLSGPTRGWTLQESDGTFTYYCLIVLGLIMAGVAYRKRRDIAPEDEDSTLPTD